MRKAVDNPDISLGLFWSNNVFISLAVFIEKWNALVDIVLGRQGCYTHKMERIFREKCSFFGMDVPLEEGSRLLCGRWQAD